MERVTKVSDNPTHWSTSTHRSRRLERILRVSRGVDSPAGRDREDLRLQRGLARGLRRAGRGARRRARPRRRRARHVPPPRDGAAPVHKLLDVRTRGGGPGDAGEDIHGARRRLCVAARRLLGRVRLPGGTEEAHWAPRLAVLRAAAGRTRISCAPRSLGAIRPRCATRVTLTLFGAFVRKESSRETLAQGKYGESRRRSSWRGPGCSSPT